MSVAGIHELNLFGKPFHLMNASSTPLLFRFLKTFSMVYRNPQDICDKLVQQCHEEITGRNVRYRRHYDSDSFRIAYDEILHTVKLSDHNVTNQLFSDDAGGHFKALGLEPEKYDPEITEDHPHYGLWQEKFAAFKYYKLPRASVRPVSFARNPLIYVYCSIIESQVVGDMMVKLLEKVPVTEGYSELISSNFSRPSYVPVSRGYINTIEIELRNNQGELIEFQSGVVTLKLHFRKCPIDN